MTCNDDQFINHHDDNYGHDVDDDSFDDDDDSFDDEYNENGQMSKSEKPQILPFHNNNDDDDSFDDDSSDEIKSNTGSNNSDTLKSTIHQNNVNHVENSCEKRQNLIFELISTEHDYIKDLYFVIEVNIFLIFKLTTINRNSFIHK